MAAKDQVKAKPTDTKPNWRHFVAIPDPSTIHFTYRPRSIRPPTEAKGEGGAEEAESETAKAEEEE